MEGIVKSGDLNVEAKLRTGHGQLETRLEGELQRHGARLEDMDDRYARSEDAVRRAEERLGDMQEEVKAVQYRVTVLIGVFRGPHVSRWIFLIFVNGICYAKAIARTMACAAHAKR